MLKPSANGPHALPVYLQVTELLIRDIASGRLIDGERLPPERDMAQRLGISVGTLRKSLADLAEKGLLERVQGSGNYIRAGNERDSIYAMFRLELLDGGGLPKAEVLDVELMQKPDDLPAFGRSHRGSRVRRLRSLNDTIIAVEEIWLDESAGVVTSDALSDSLYLFYQTKLGFWIRRAEDRVSVGAAPEWTPPEFTRSPGDVTGYVERLSWSDQDWPVEYSRTWFDTERAIYVQRLK